MTTSARLLLLIGLVTVTGAASARAQAPRERSAVATARAHFEQGQRLYNVSQYREALAEFKKGFLAKDDPVFLFNIAQCHRLLGERAEALTYYRRFLRTAPESPNRAEVERRIRELEAASAGPPPAPVAPLVPPAPIPVPHPPAVPDRASPPPAPVRAPEAAVTGGVGPVEDRTDDGGPIYSRWWFWAGAAALIAGGVTAGLLLNRRDGAVAGCGGNVDTCIPL